MNAGRTCRLGSWGAYRRARTGSTAPMDPVTETPTEPVDYAALNAIWGALATGLLLTTSDDAPPPRELPL
jgi:hypothetical protein